MANKFPAEFAAHAATWIAWPHHEPDWPGKLAPIPWVYAEIVRALSDYDRVEILCHDESVAENARTLLAAHGVKPTRYGIHLVGSDRVWLRDSAPTGTVRAEMLLRRLLYSFIMTEDFNPLVSAQDAHDLRIHPRNRLELAGPVGLVVRPRDPCRRVCRKLGGKFVCHRADVG